MATNFCHKQLVRLLSTQGNQLNLLYSEKARELASVLKKYNLKDPRNVWKGNVASEKEIEKILLGLDSNVKRYLLSNVNKSTNLSNNCNDAMAEKYLAGKSVSESVKTRIMSRNVEALAAFQLSRQKNMALSSAVWNLAGQAKDQLEYFLAEGLAEGTSAKTLATDVKKYLKEPNRRFRRVRNAEGKLVLSNPAKLYKPSSGVYRSSYANALRLTRNEINIAYRQADHLRRQEMDFVIGYRVNLSNAHPVYDICDELAGEYPKNFQFWGWHPNCICFTTSILMPDKDFVNGVNKGNFDNAKNITKIPVRATNYLNEKSNQIKGWKSKPYFIDQNFKNVKGGFALKKHIVSS